MKSIPDWVQAVVAVVLFLGAMGSMYAANQVAIASLEQRVTSLEVMQAKREERSMQVLDNLADSVDKLSISVARLDERLNAVEKEGR